MKHKKSQLGWLPEEDAIVRNRYATMGALKLVPFLPGRTRDAVASRAITLGVTKKVVNMGYPWPRDELAAVWRQWTHGGERGVLRGAL